MSYMRFVKDLPDEQWKRIAPNTICEVSNMGRVKLYSTRMCRETLLEPRVQNGKLVVVIPIAGIYKNYFLDQLVLTTFRGARPKNKKLAHRDSDEANCKLTNLTWVDIKRVRNIVTSSLVRECYKHILEGKSIHWCTEEYDVSYSTLARNLKAFAKEEGTLDELREQLKRNKDTRANRRARRSDIQRRESE